VRLLSAARKLGLETALAPTTPAVSAQISANGRG